jgi:hypothetical protein
MSLTITKLDILIHLNLSRIGKEIEFHNSPELLAIEEAILRP